MSVLAAFESAARLQSFTASAAELHLTQSAVSRQIRSLEDLLGAELFVRERQTVRLTAAGEAYAHEIRRALQQIATATLGFRANPQGGTLNLAILPTFGTRWLAPRLPKFQTAHPGITINLSTRLAPFDFQRDPLDAAIHFGSPEWSGAKLDFLMKETVVPACSPELRARFKLRNPADLLAAPLVHLVSRPDAWERWLRAAGVEFDEVHGMLVDQFAVAAQAAIAGLGVALLPTFLIEAELARQDLVLAVDKPMKSADNYYLAWPVSRETYPPLQAFRQWIQDEARSDDLSAA
ncbi:LysR family transcriptional regulator [Caenimonas sp. S4]|nr:LysR family transcriptional regulator [Caenimonas soli]